MSDSPSSYDEVPYDSLPFAQTHPSHLAAVATLFGLKPPPVERARVLELGCASGGNLIPMAESLPGGEFVGVDLSARQIEDGARLLRKSGIANVSLRHASIADIDDTYGRFDYVVCHGVFSWVPREVQEKVFDVCSRQLTPNGIAYVSYNTYPGWHLRGMIREMMRYHALRFDSPREQIAQARALLDFLVQSTNQTAGAYNALLRGELELMRNQSDHYLYHEQLEDVNEPLYFHQFVGRAAEHGLRYLGESRVTTMLGGNFGADVQKTLALLSADQIQSEQYLDFVRNRTFRETLLVRAGQAPDWGITPERLFGLHVASPAKAARKVDLASNAPAQFQSRSGMVVSAANPICKAAMMALAEAWPGVVPFAELVRSAAERLGRAPTSEDSTALATALLNVHVSSDLIELFAAPLRFAREAGERPVAIPYARASAAEGQAAVANRRHEAVRLSDITRRLLPLLDGTRDRAALVEALAELALAGELTVQAGGKAVTNPAEIRASLTAALRPALDELARDALLDR